MTLRSPLQDRPADPTCSPPGPGPRVGARSRFHHLGLGLLLLALVPVAGTHAVWSADEGALLYQATAVADGRGWTFPHPFPSADPTGTWFPIHLAGFAPDGDYIVLGKHALFVRLVGLVEAVGGYPAVLLLSVLGALGAAAATARLAARIEPRAGVPALWLAGLASPLFLSAYVAWGHTLGAALVGWALVGLTTRPHRPPPSGRAPLPTVTAHLGGGLALAAACTIRTEAAVAGLALASTLALAAVAGRLRRRSAGPCSTVEATAGHPRWWLPAVVAGLATATGIGLDRATAQTRAGPVRPPGDLWGGLSGRAEGFYHTWLRPEFSDRPENLLLLVGAGAVVVAGTLARRRGAGADPVVAALAVAAFALGVRFLISPVALVPGLAVAFPTLLAGLVLIGGQDLARPPTGTLLAFTGLFWAGVLATQYRTGGGGEWGGRYFALGLPAAIAAVTPALVRTIDGLRGPRRRPVLGLGLVVVLLPVTMGLLGLRQARDTTLALTSLVDQRLAEGDEGTTPVLVTTLAPLGRWAWHDVDRSRWLLVATDDLAEVGDRLDGLDIERLVFVSDDPERDLGALRPWFTPSDRGPANGRSGLDRIVIPMSARDR